MPDRPDDMHTAGRDPVRDFDRDECGYHRVKPSLVQSDDTVDPANVQCPDLSSNRSKFSEPYYVLYPRADFGHFAIFKFFYREVLPTVASPNAGGGDPVEYAIRTIHVPEPDNYGHCETRFYRGEQHMEPNKISRGAKKLFREHMSRIMELERKPGAPFPP
jgi:hypothetical protein